MKYKIFYRPETREIMGFSDGAVAMEMPFVEVETDIVLHSSETYKIQKIDGDMRLVIENTVI